MSRAHPTHTALWIAAGCTVGVIALLWPTFVSMVALWERDATFAHGFLVPPIVLFLLWRARSQLLAVQPRPAPVAVVLIVLLCAIWVLGRLSNLQLLQYGAAVALIPASLWCVLGSEFARRAAFPLFYLLFAVPAGDELVPPLMRLTADITVAGLHLSGIPVWRDGLYFSIPSGDFEVVKACSGIRYLIASMALGALYAYLSYRSNWRRAAFLALAILVPLVANGLRAYGIVVIAYLSDMRFATGVDHLVYGWIFFGLVMAITFWIGSLFRDAGPERSATVAGSTASSSDLRIAPPIVAAVVALALVALGPLAIARIHLAAQQVIPAMQLRLPESSGDWTGPGKGAPTWRPEFSGAHASASGSYTSGAQSVQVNLEAYSHEQGEAQELATSLNRIADGTLWKARTELPATITIGAGSTRAAIETRIAARGHRRLVWHWFLVNGSPSNSHFQVKLAQLRSWLGGRTPQSAAIILSTDTDGNLAAARARLAQFSNRLAERLELCAMQADRGCQ